MASAPVEKFRDTPPLAGTALPEADTLSIPVIRLFDQRDIEFLRAVPGYAARMETAFRRRRCRIFRAWLRSLKAEFLARGTALETLPLPSPAALVLLRCRLRFAWAMVPAWLCFFRYRCKLGPVDLAPVAQRFQAIRDDIHRWTLALS